MESFNYSWKVDAVLTVIMLVLGAVLYFVYMPCESGPFGIIQGIADAVSQGAAHVFAK